MSGFKRRELTKNIISQTKKMEEFHDLLRDEKKMGFACFRDRMEQKRLADAE